MKLEKLKMMVIQGHLDSSILQKNNFCTHIIYSLYLKCFYVEIFYYPDVDCVNHDCETISEQFLQNPK